MTHIQSTSKFCSSNLKICPEFNHFSPPTLVQNNFLFLGYDISHLTNSPLFSFAHLPFTTHTIYFQHNLQNDLLIEQIILCSYSAQKSSSRFIFHSEGKKKPQSLSMKAFLFCLFYLTSFPSIILL